MGVYGLQSWGEYFSRQIAREVEDERRRVQRIHSRMDRTQGLIARGEGVDGQAEPLGCPSCRASFEFGDHCPACDVELVGGAWVGAVEPVPRRDEQRLDRWLRVGAFHVAAFATCVALTAVFLWADPGPQLVIFGHHEQPPMSAPVGAAAVPQRIAWDATGMPLTPRLAVVRQGSVLAAPGPEIHLVGPGGELGGPLDCPVGSTTAALARLDWGLPGTPADDPQFAAGVGAAGGGGVRILAPAPGTYSVVLVDGAGARRDHAEVLVLVDGQPVIDDSFTVRDGARTICEIEFPGGEVTLL